jgi:predicted nucleic acid-binding protein
MTLIDTSSWIEFLRGRESPASLRVRSLLMRGEAAWCDITLVELWNGARGCAEKKALADLENELPVLPISEQVWSGARTLTRRAREKGVIVSTVDIIIAACAAISKTPLEHCDTHFESIIALAADLQASHRRKS